MRIYPAFWVSILVILIIPYFTEAISSLKTGHFTPPENVISRFSSWEWINVLLLTKVFFATSENLQAEFSAINAVYWTLAIEFQFYLVITFALYLKKFFRHTLVLLSIAALLIKAIPVNLNNGLFIHFWLSFAVGIALAYLHRSGIRFRFDANIRTALVICLVTVTFYMAYYIAPINLHTSPILFALAFGVCLWFISDAESALQKIKHTKNWVIYWLLEFWLIVGAMSYSLYLLHVKLYLIPLMVVRHLASLNSIFFGLLTIIGTLVICYPFYYYVERRYLSKNYKRIHQVIMTTAPVSSSR